MSSFDLALIVIGVLVVIGFCWWLLPVSYVHELIERNRRELEKERMQNQRPTTPDRE